MKRNKSAARAVVAAACASALALSFFMKNEPRKAPLFAFAAASLSLSYPKQSARALKDHMADILYGDDELAAPEQAAPQIEPELEPPKGDEGLFIENPDAEAVPEERRYPIEQIQFASHISADNFFSYGAGCVRNATDYANAEMLEAASGALGFQIEFDSDEPQILVMHTHTTESFDPYDAGFYDVEYPTRSTDERKNISAVGKRLCDTLNSLGINTVHAPDCHDYPSYNNSYSRSAETVKTYLENYPSIKIVLDIHRDGMEREDKTRVKPTVVINGRKAAQIMIISGADDGTMGMPNFRENLKLAVRLQDSAETLCPGLTRPLYLAYRHYNQDLTTGSLLIEFGSEASTLDEALYSAELVGEAVAAALRG